MDFRASQLWMVTGRPGAGKSFFAQWLMSEVVTTSRAAGDVKRGIYFFMDGTALTAGVRAAAWATGHRTEEVLKALDGPGAEYYEQALAEIGHDITYVFDRRSEAGAIQEAVDAFVELWDEHPAWMVFDNLRNLAGGDEGHEAKKEILSYLGSLAASTGASVCVLHHASESGVRDYAKPPTASQTEDKVTQYPEMVLGVAKDPNSDAFRLSVAKLRDGGASDPMADRPVEIYADLSRVRFTSQAPTGLQAWVP
ncbi:MAG: AAA family ATPase [Dermatophilaceae bacterium]